jgi:hypothetical protein
MPTICPQCFTAFRGPSICPACQFQISRQPKIVHNKAGMLYDVTNADLVKAQPPSMQRYWDRCLGCMAHRGSQAGAAAKMFIRQYNVPPWQAGVTPLPRMNEWHRRVADLFPQFMRKKQ